MRLRNSFIPVHGVGDTTERDLWRRGVHDWDDFDGTGVGHTLADRIRDFIDDARTRLDERDAEYFAARLPTRSHWRLFEDFRDDACYLDIETTGLHRDAAVTVVTAHRAGETTTLVRGRDLTRGRLHSLLADTPLLVTYNGKTFDVPQLERAFDLDIDRPHLDLRYPCARLGIDGGLTAAERAVGVTRDRPDLDGRDAVRLWRRYERGDENALSTLVGYNREDTVNLQPVTEAVTARLHADVFEAATRSE